MFECYQLTRIQQMSNIGLANCNHQQTTCQNIVAKGSMAHNEQFLLLPQFCFITIQ